MFMALSILASMPMIESVLGGDIQDRIVLDGGMILIFDDAAAKDSFDYTRCYNATASKRVERQLRSKISKRDVKELKWEEVKHFFAQNTDPDIYVNFTFRGRAQTEICGRDDLIYIKSVK